MLADNEIRELAGALMVTAEAMGDALSSGAAAIMADDLSEYPLQVTLDALKAVRRECKGRLALADILKRVQTADGHPGPNEAWAIAMRSNDEAATVVWTDEIAQAMSVASPILETRDTVGARVAFIEAYERIIKQAREAGKRPGWYASIGHDPMLRDQALKDAVDAGRLLPAHVNGLLPAPVSKQAQEVAGLLTGSTSRPTTIPPDVLERLDKIVKEMQDADVRRREEAHARCLRDREATERKKAEIAAAVEELTNQKSEEQSP